MDKDSKQIYEDEIDLLELAAAVWKRKLYIIGFVFLVSAAAVIYSLSLDNVYESAAILKPTEQTATSSSLGGLGALAGFAGINISSGGSVFADINVLLNNRKFVADFVKKNNLASRLVDEQAFFETSKFKQNEKYYLYRMVKPKITVSQDKPTTYIAVVVRDENAALANEMLSLLLKEISLTLKTKHMENIDKRIDNYKLEIDKATDMILKHKLSELVSNLIQSKVLANADEYYGFSIIAEPSLPDSKEKAGPYRARMCIIAFFSSFILAVCAVLFIELIKRNRKNGMSAG